MIKLAEQCVADYDENGWRDSTWLDPSDVAIKGGAGDNDSAMRVENPN